jgi:hypothetical protein
MKVLTVLEQIILSAIVSLEDEAGSDASLS